MGATDRLTLLLEAKQIGLQDVLRMEQAINRVIDQAQKTKGAGDAVASSTSRATQATQAFGQNVAQFIRDPLGSASTAAESFVTKLGPMGIALGGVGAAAIAGGAALIGFIKSTGDAAEKILNLSITTGLTATEVQQFSAALSLSGASIEDLEKASVTLNQRLSDTGQVGQQARKALADIGVSIYDSNGKIKEAGPLILDLSKGLSSIADRTEQTRIGYDLLGKSLRVLLPAFTELTQNIEITKRDGIGIDEKTLQNADALGDKLARVEGKLSQAWTVAKALTATLAEPVLDTLLSPTAGRQKRGGSIGGEEPFVAPAATRSVTLPAQALLSGALAGATSLEAQRRQLSDLSTQIDSQRLKLENLKSTSGLTIEAAKREVEALRSIEAQHKKLEAAIKATEKAEREFEKLNALGTFTVTDQYYATRSRQLFASSPGLAGGPLAFLNEGSFGVTGEGVVGNPTPSLRRSSLPTGPLVVSEADIAAVNPGGGRDGFRALQDQAFAAGLAESARAAAARDRSLQLESDQQAIAFQTERLRLIAGPGGELAAVRAIAQIRLEGVERELKLTGDIGAADRQRLQVARDRQLEELRYSKERDDRNRQTGGQVFDALLAGGGGIRNFTAGLGLGFGRQIFGNAFAELARGTTGLLQLPGQQNANGTPNFLGRILAGTPFGLDPQKVALDANTIATQANTAALLGGGTGGSLRGLLTGGGAIGVPGVFGSGAGSNPLIFSATGRSSGIIGSDGLPLGIVGQGLGLGYPSTGLTTTQKIGLAGGLVAGGLQIKSGVQQGGAAGTLNAASGAASILATGLTLAGVSGPAAPIIAGVALGAATIAALLPNQREKRSRGIDQLVWGSRYVEPDVEGVDTDYAQGGTIAPTKGGIVVIQNINAADAKSFMDRRDDIAAAVQQAIAEVKPITQEIRRTVDLGSE